MPAFTHPAISVFRGQTSLEKLVRKSRLLSKTSSMYTILVPYDFSDESVNALSHAATIAGARGAKLVLLHVVTPAVEPVVPSQHKAGRSEESVRMLRLVKDVRHQLEDIVRVRHMEASVGDIQIKMAAHGLGIDKVIAGTRANLLVMGSQGFHASEELFISSIAEKVVSHSPNPVIIVKKDTQPRPLKRIAYACTFKRVSEKKCAALAAFVKNTRVHIHLLRVMDTPHPDRRAAAQKMDTLGKAIQPDTKMLHTEIILSENVKEALQAYIDDHDIDLLAMHTHHLLSPGRFFNKGVVEPVVNTMNRPVMLLNLG